MRLPARIQHTREGGVHELQPQRLLRQRRRLQLPARRPRDAAPALPALRQGVLPPGPAVQQEARAEDAVRVLPRRLLPVRAAVQGGRAPAVPGGLAQAHGQGGEDGGGDGGGEGEAAGGGGSAGAEGV